jgi:predicted kinase
LVLRLRRGFGRSLWGILSCELLVLVGLMCSGRKALKEQRKDEIAVEQLTDIQEKRSLEPDSSK